MGVFDFFRRRRERESAIPDGMSESLSRQLKGDGEPIGQPVEGVGAPQGINLFGSGSIDLGNLGGLAGMIGGLVQQAAQAGNVEIKTDSQVIDMRGSGLREEIMEAMRQHGIDPESGAAQGQVNAADYQGLQEQIMQALRNAGVDVQMRSGMDIQIQGGTDADAGPGHGGPTDGSPGA